MRELFGIGKSIAYSTTSRAANQGVNRVFTEHDRKNRLIAEIEKAKVEVTSLHTMMTEYEAKGIVSQEARDCYTNAYNSWNSAKQNLEASVLDAADTYADYAVRYAQDGKAWLKEYERRLIQEMDATYKAQMNNASKESTEAVTVMKRLEKTEGVIGILKGDLQYYTGPNKESAQKKLERAEQLMIEAKGSIAEKKYHVAAVQLDSVDEWVNKAKGDMK